MIRNGKSSLIKQATIYPVYQLQFHAVLPPVVGHPEQEWYLLLVPLRECESMLWVFLSKCGSLSWVPLS